ncbi:hypothetical protein EDB84DRAFT_1442000 [Lactarius hengduanensis]|nr:hypothetical protein EDB84DRAFT_1442000 [Lactarius hengduanensis]
MNQNHKRDKASHPLLFRDATKIKLLNVVILQPSVIKAESCFKINEPPLASVRLKLAHKSRENSAAQEKKSTDRKNLDLGASQERTAKDIWDSSADARSDGDLSSIGKAEGTKRSRLRRECLVSVPLMGEKAWKRCLGLVAEVLKKQNGQKSGKHETRSRQMRGPPGLNCGKSVKTVTVKGGDLKTFKTSVGSLEGVWGNWLGAVDWSESQRGDASASARGPNQFQCPLPRSSSYTARIFVLPPSLKQRFQLPPLPHLRTFPAPQLRGLRLAGCGVLEDALGLSRCLHSFLLYHPSSIINGTLRLQLVPLFFSPIPKFAV